MASWHSYIHKDYKQSHQKLVAAHNNCLGRMLNTNKHISYQDINGLCYKYYEPIICWKIDESSLNQYRISNTNIISKTIQINGISLRFTIKPDLDNEDRLYLEILLPPFVQKIICFQDTFWLESNMQRKKTRIFKRDDDITEADKAKPEWNAIMKPIKLDDLKILTVLIYCDILSIQYYSGHESNMNHNQYDKCIKLEKSVKSIYKFKYPLKYRSKCNVISFRGVPSSKEPAVLLQSFGISDNWMVNIDKDFFFGKTRVWLRLQRLPRNVKRIKVGWRVIGKTNLSLWEVKKAKYDYFSYGSDFMDSYYKQDKYMNVGWLLTNGIIRKLEYVELSLEAFVDEVYDYNDEVVPEDKWCDYEIVPGMMKTKICARNDVFNIYSSIFVFHDIFCVFCVYLFFCFLLVCCIFVNAVILR